MEKVTKPIRKINTMSLNKVQPAENKFTKNNGKNLNWEAIFNEMIKDCKGNPINTKYQEIIQSVMDKNIEQREIESEDMYIESTFCNDIMATGGFSGSICLHLISEEPLRLKSKFTKNLNIVQFLQFSSDGKYLKVSSTDKPMFVWNVDMTKKNYDEWNSFSLELQGDDKILEDYVNFFEINSITNMMIMRKNESGFTWVVDIKDLNDVKIISKDLFGEDDSSGFYLAPDGSSLVELSTVNGNSIYSFDPNTKNFVKGNSF